MALYPESPSFRDTPEVGDPEDDDGKDEDSGRHAVFDLYTAGHGFQVEGLSERKVWHCHYCGQTMLNPAGTWWCRFSGMVTERPEVAPGRLCECGWCLWNLDVPQEGGPHRQQCGSTECQRQYNREQKAARRAELDDLDRFKAVEVIRQDSSRSNKDIATLLGIRPVRVKEAREKLSV